MSLKKKILVVGGAGYIGSYVNKFLNESGYETVVLDNLSTGDARSVTRGLLVKGDLGNKEDLEALFSKHRFDAVMHFAAFIDVGESVDNPAIYYENNVVNTLILLEMMMKYEINTFIFSSTAAIFGLPTDGEEPISEEHPKQPINPYGESKWMVEKILRDFDAAYSLRFSCLRYFNAAGGDPTGEVKYYKKRESNLIPVALKSLLNGQEITIFGTDYPTRDGTGVRDYIHIHDLATAHVAAMEELFNGHPSTYYNLGNGRGFSVKEVLAAIERTTKRRLRIKEGKRRPGDPASLVAGSWKAKEELGWMPKYPELDTIVLDCWNVIYANKELFE